MSQRPSASRPAASSPTEGRENPLPPLRPRDDSYQDSRQAAGPGQERPHEYGNQRPVHEGRTPQFPMTEQPLQGAAVEGERRHSGSSRGLGVHNILNPTYPEPAGGSTPHITGRTTSSPQSGEAAPSQYLTGGSSGFTPQSYEAQQTASPSQGQARGGASGRGRNMLVPKSPRSISLGVRGAAMITAQQSPFLSSRGHVYAADPGSATSSDIPPMPLPPGQSQHPYNVPQHSTTDPRRTTSVAMPAPLRTPLSQSASPSPSVRSSYSVPSQASPAVRFAQGQQHSQSASYFPGSSFVSGPQQGEGFQTGHSGTEGPYMTPLPESLLMGRQSSGQNPNIRMLPISTEHGPMFMPVDVTAASKVADEKRARNAGASARFRARRKEKEKEANNTIGNMQKELKDKENQLKEMEIERDFYRNERDRFRDIVYRNPSTRDLALQTPPSPRLTRTPAYPPPASGSIYQTEPEAHHETGRPPQRRRVNQSGDFTLGGQPTSNFPPPSFTPAPYPAQSYNPASTSSLRGLGQSPPNLPPLRMENPSNQAVSGAPTSSSILPPTSQPSSFDPYPRGGYDRGWPGGPSGLDDRKPPRQ